MTDEESTRRATIRTEHDRPELVAAALRPDNTAEMTTVVDDGAVVTTIERATTSSLRATVDDYAVSVDVADRTVRTAREHITQS